MENTLSFATAYGGNVISHQETNKATTMAVTLVTELQNFICPHQEFVSRSFFQRSRRFFGRRGDKARRQIRHRRWRIVNNSMQAKAQPEAQLGDRRSQSDEPRRGSVVASHTHIVCFAFHTQASCRRRRRIVVNSMQAKAQLGDRRRQRDEPRRGSVVAKVSDYIHKRVSAIPPRFLLTAVHSRSFFSAKPTFYSFPSI